MRCEALNVFALVENYGYGQLYGVRLAKYKTNRFMLCGHCEDGYGLDKEQWEQAKVVAQGLKPRIDSLTMKDMAESAVELARMVFPDMADDVREILARATGRGSGRGPEDEVGAIDAPETSATRRYARTARQSRLQLESVGSVATYLMIQYKTSARRKVMPLRRRLRAATASSV